MSSTLQLQTDPKLENVFAHIRYDEPPVVDNEGNVDGDWDERKTNGEGYTAFMHVEPRPCFVLFRAAGYLDALVGVSMPHDALITVPLTLKPLQRLTARGSDVFHADGRPFVENHCTNYLLAQRFHRGEVIDSLLYHGFDGYNVTFLMKIVPNQIVLPDFTPDTDPQFYNKSRDFFAYMREKRKRVEATLLCDCRVMGWDLTKQITHTNTLYEVLQEFPENLVQLCNEPENGVNGVDYGAFAQPPNLFWCRGSSLAGGPCPLPAGNYSNQHLARQGGGAWLDAQPYYMVDGYPNYAGVHGPCFTNETRGASDTTNSDSRTTNPDYFRRIAGAMRQWGGGTFHPEFGIHSEHYEAGKPQDQCRAAFVRGITGA